MIRLTDQEIFFAREVMASSKFRELRDAQAGDGFAAAIAFGASTDQAHDIAVSIGLDPGLRKLVPTVGFAGLAVHQCLSMFAAGMPETGLEDV